MKRHDRPKAGQKRILVTGATGKTGAYTASILLARGPARGHDVRAFVHRDDDRAADLRERGADVEVGDLVDVDAVAVARQIANIALDCRVGIFSGTNDIVERVGGIEPTTVSKFVRAHESAFSR